MHLIMPNVTKVVLAEFRLFKNVSSVVFKHIALNPNDEIKPNISSLEAKKGLFNDP